MTPTTPVEVKYTKLSCPNPVCSVFNQPGQGNITHRAWTGKHKAIERLDCRVCGQEFSERAGTLMAQSTLPDVTVERLLKCQRWGVCDDGTADICNVDLKTVQRCQQVAACRAAAHHRQVVQHVAVEGVQMDEAHSKLRRNQVAWILTALAMPSLFLLWVEVGPRTQETATALMAQGRPNMWTGTTHSVFGPTVSPSRFRSRLKVSRSTSHTRGTRPAFRMGSMSEGAV